MHATKQESLSTYTSSLISELEKIYTKKEPLESEFVDISKAVSFFALLYERLRNVIEFKDENIIRRNAINRIISRRLAFNSNLTDEATSIAKEIAWTGYYKIEKIPESTIQKLDKAVVWYITLRNTLAKGEQRRKARYWAEFIKDLLVCQIEQLFDEQEFHIERTFLFYLYQVLNPRIVVEGLSAEEKDLLVYIAVERMFLKSDTVYLRFHLMRLLFEDLLKVSPDKFVEYTAEFKKAFHFIDTHIAKPQNRKIVGFLRNQRPAYLILKELMLKNREALPDILLDQKKLEAHIDDLAREKYALSREKLTRAGIRSFLYIFLTKMVFVFVLEYPIMVRDEHLNYTALGINAFFPPLLMAIILLLTSAPGEENTQRIIRRVKELSYRNEVQPIIFRAKKHKQKNFVFSTMFWAFYFFTFALTFFAIDEVLNYFLFPWYSKIIFFFFVTAVSFFSHRVRQIAKEYMVKQKDWIFTPIVDFFMVPLISVGKWLSSEISKINILIFIFDFLIEAPFKVLFEVIEEWIYFVKKRKEEIV